MRVKTCWLFIQTNVSTVACVSLNGPIDAIIPDSDPEAEKFLELNRDYAEKWPVLTTKKDALPEAEEYKGHQRQNEFL